MGVIYGLYSTSDGLVRYVGQTEYTVKKSVDSIITKALDCEPGVLCEWLRDEWRADHEVLAQVLQDNIIPADLEMFQKYWIEQFSGLLNVKPPADPARETSDVGQRVNASILELLRGETTA